jgi:hypothetical protein
VRGIFFDEDEARAVERQLAADGFEVTLEKVAYAGEDDDEDHPWAVTTDAPGVVLELLVERYDGWLDEDPDTTNDAPKTPRPPLDLPAAPKRHHRPEGL